MNWNTSANGNKSTRKLSVNTKKGLKTKEMIIQASKKIPIQFNSFFNYKASKVPRLGPLYEDFQERIQGSDGIYSRSCDVEGIQNKWKYTV